MSFRQLEDDDHHHGATPLCNLPINMIKAFPIDYMHLVCLGVMRHLILAWVQGKPGQARLAAQDIRNLSQTLVSYVHYTPSDFSRKPRELKEIKRNKATEYRQLLLYTGPVAFKNVLSEDAYGHFMLFHVAMSLLIRKCTTIEQKKYCKELLKMFVSHSPKIYGTECLVYNMHGLLHLADDSKNYGCLDDFSGFCFENYLQKLKKIVRTPNRPLQQVIRRLGEMEDLQDRKSVV